MGNMWNYWICDRSCLMQNYLELPTMIPLHALTIQLSPLSAVSAATHGLSPLFPLFLFIIFHPLCLLPSFNQWLFSFSVFLVCVLCLSFVVCHCSCNLISHVGVFPFLFLSLPSLSFSSSTGGCLSPSLFFSSLTYFPHRSIVSNCLSNFHLGQWLG